jgi:Zn-dependent protease/predicted transcriptional regulator
MGASIRLGRILGIPLDVNWGWLIVFGLITWTLGSGVFPAENPGLSRATYYAMAVVASLLFFGCLILHELGHALVARREGMEIEGITLWLFGGVARFASGFPSAGAELRIASAGPLVTLVLGGAFVAAEAWLPLPNAVDGVVAWLGYINLLLLVFNLIPALPLDGGRILRSILWKLKRDYAWATIRVALAGRAFALLMVGGGIVLFIFRGAFEGVWFAAIGWFLYQASTLELRGLAVGEALHGLKVRNVMTRDAVTLEPDARIGDALDALGVSERHSGYPVVDDHRPLGLFSAGTLAGTPRPEWENQRVGDFMLGLDQVPSIDPETDAADAVELLQGTPLRHALVLEDGRLAGVLTLSDLADAVELRRPIRPRRARR